MVIDRVKVTLGQYIYIRETDRKHICRQGKGTDWCALPGKGKQAANGGWTAMTR